MAAGSTGHSSLIVPTNTSSFHKLVSDLRAHHRGMHGQVSDVAANLRSILPDVIAERGGAHRNAMGVDAKFKAYRIVRPLMDIAALDDQIARLYVVSYTRYVDLVVNAKAAKPKSSFNADV